MPSSHSTRRENAGRSLIKSIENNAHSFKDGNTRRSAKGAPQKISTDFLRGPRTCTGGVTASCKSRRALRPRKLDVTLSRHGHRARRVAFLRPCRSFSEYRSPLDYVSAILKPLVEAWCQSRILGVRYSILHGGGKPEWGSPQNVHFVGSPGRRGINIPRET